MPNAMPRFHGSLTALITPFDGGKVNEKALQELVEWQIAQGTHGLVPCGTTGESPTLSHTEHVRIVKLCVEAAAGRVPVIAGGGSNSTEEAISLCEAARDAGAEALLVVVPYYNKPTQEGLYQHFKAIHDSVDHPIFVYNIPGRSVVDMQPGTLRRLARLTNIIGVKDATADLARPLKTRLDIGDVFIQLSGEDATVAAFLAQGGVGCISVTSNVAPALCAQLHNAWAARDFETFNTVRDQLMPLHAALFVETSPAPAKYALSLLGKCREELRLPLVPISEQSRSVVRQAMQDSGILGTDNGRPVKSA